MANLSDRNVIHVCRITIRRNDQIYTTNHVSHIQYHWFTYKNQSMQPELSRSVIYALTLRVASAAVHYSCGRDHRYPFSTGRRKLGRRLVSKVATFEPKSDTGVENRSDVSKRSQCFLLPAISFSKLSRK